MTEKNNQMLVQLNATDLQQLIATAVKTELENFKSLIQLKPKDSENESNLLTREETSKLLKVSHTTLFHWSNKNILCPKKLGRKVFYLKSEVYNKLNSTSIA